MREYPFTAKVFDIDRVVRKAHILESDKQISKPYSSSLTIYFLGGKERSTY